MKAITEKVNKLKEIETLKQAKQIQKEQLAKQYDEMIANAKPISSSSLILLVYVCNNVFYLIIFDVQYNQYRFSLVNNNFSC